MKKNRFIDFFKNKKRFRNLHSEGLKYGLLYIILWKLGYYKKKDFVLKNIEKKIEKKPFDHKKPFLTWIGHSTFFLKIDNIFILTDPIWSKKCYLFGPNRFFKPSIDMEDLKKVDYVLISHNHYDHLDRYTILKLHSFFPNIKWIVPDGVKRWFEKRKIKNVIELNNWETISFGDIKITAVPSQHFSGRNVFDYNKSLWLGYVFEKGEKRFYFAGDTGYNPYDFKDIGEKFKSMDLSMIPIGAYIPEKFLSPIHINPKEALVIHKEVNSKLTVGMHWNTFCLSDEPRMLPLYDLHLALKEKKVDPSSFITLDFGEYINW